MTSSLLPDAAPTNWVDRHAPVGLRPWLKLGRFDRPAGIWLLMLPGWQGLAMAAAERGRWPDPWLLLAFLVGATLMRAAGCAFNDIVDRDIDAKVARTAMRPVASGQISVRGALGFLVVCSLLTGGPSWAMRRRNPFLRSTRWRRPCFSRWAADSSFIST